MLPVRPPCLPLQVMGLVEELCSQSSLHHFSWRVAQQPALRPLRPVYHIASEFASLMEQVGWGRGEAHCGEAGGAGYRSSQPAFVSSFGGWRSCDLLAVFVWPAQIDVMDGMGLAHQDIKARRLSMCSAGAGAWAAEDEEPLTPALRLISPATSLPLLPFPASWTTSWCTWVAPARCRC